jgi:hypothetical protein
MMVKRQALRLRVSRHSARGRRLVLPVVRSQVNNGRRRARLAGVMKERNGDVENCLMLAEDGKAGNANSVEISRRENAS